MHACCGPGKNTVCSGRMDAEHRVWMVSGSELSKETPVQFAKESILSIIRCFVFLKMEYVRSFFIVGMKYLTNSYLRLPSCSLWIKPYLVSWQEDTVQMEAVSCSHGFLVRKQRALSPGASLALLFFLSPGP